MSITQSEWAIILFMIPLAICMSWHKGGELRTIIEISSPPVVEPGDRIQAFKLVFTVAFFQDLFFLLKNVSFWAGEIHMS